MASSGLRARTMPPDIARAFVGAALLSVLPYAALASVLSPWPAPAALRADSR